MLLKNLILFIKRPRKDELILYILMLFLFFIFIFLYFSFGGEKNITLHVAYTDVLFGQIDSETIYKKDNRGHLIKEKISGMSLISSQINKFKQETNIAKEKEFFLLLDAGNAIVGGPGKSSEQLKTGSIMVSIMNEIKYDAMVVSNSEFDFGIENLKNIASKANFPLLGANIVEKTSKDIPSFLRPYTIINYPGLRVGVIGLVNPLLLKLSYPGLIDKIEPLSVFEVTKKYIKELKHKDVELIILLSSIWDLDTELKLAKMFVQDISLIVSSSKFEEKSSNTTIYSPAIPIVKIPRTNRYVGKMDLVIDAKTKKVIKHSQSLYKIDSKNLKEDRKITDIINNNIQFLEQQVLDRTIGYLVNDLKYETTKESAFGDFVCDIVLSYVGADVVFVNSGTLRGLSKGEITIRKITRAIPYTNAIFSMNLKGSDIKEILERVFYTKSDTGIFQIAGIRFNYNYSLPKGHMLKDITIKGKPLDLQKDYRVATIEYLYRGGDGYSMFFKKGRNVIKHPILLNDLVITHIKDQEKVYDPEDGRMLELK